MNHDKYPAGLFMEDRYKIFGLNVMSEIRLPALAILDNSRHLAPDVLIEYGDTPDHLEDCRSIGTHLQVAPGKLLLSIDSVARYCVSGGNHITITPTPGATPESILIFLMGSAIGALLQQRKILVLHAGAITAKQSGMVFLGPSGIGKSTLAAGFHHRGYPFLADDVCAVDTTNEIPSIIPGFPRLKLWSDALKRMGKHKDSLTSILSRGDLEKYLLPVDHQHETPIPINALFNLEVMDTKSVDITPLSGMAKIHPLIGNTYRPAFLDGLGIKKDHFQQCAAVAARVSVYQVTRPRQGFLLDELMDALEAKF